MMEKGTKTSELWLVVSMIAPNILQQFGINFATLVGKTDDIVATIQAAHDKGGSGAMLLVGLYVAGRIALKWRARNNENPKD